MIARAGELVVERDPRRASGRLLRDGAMEASYVDLGDPRHLEFDYMRWMRTVIRVVRARRVLHLGGGACALARALALENPGGLQEVCEVDGDVLALAREHLGLRRGPGLRVRHAEGRAFLGEQPDDAYDAVIVDAFVGASVPRRLITRQAFGHAARLAPLALINVVDARSGHEVTLAAAGLASAYRRVWSAGGRAGNTMLAGSAAALDLKRIAAGLAADPSPATVTPPGAMARLIAGTPPLEDAGLDDA